MTAKPLSTRDRMFIAAVLFGDGGSVDDVDFRFRAYERLLTLAAELGEEIEEFDIIAALEELGSFRSRQELREIALSLRLLEHHGEDGLQRLRRDIYFNELRPGEHPYTKRAAFPTDFVRVSDEQGIVGPVLADDILATFVTGAQQVLAAAQDSGHALVTPFFRLSDGKLSPIGSAPATTPLLDLYTLMLDVAAAIPDRTNHAVEAFSAAADPWLDHYFDLLLTNDQFGDEGALCLNDDDDYPGATRPTVPSNAILLPVLLRHDGWRKIQNRPRRSDLADIIRRLTEFLLAHQNDDGGWPVYRYRSPLFQGKPAQQPSVPLFSFLAYAGLIDAFFDGDPALADAIRAAATRYGDHIEQTAIRSESGAVSWYASPNAADRRSDHGATATNLQACLLLPIILKERAETFRSLAVGAVQHFADTWTVGSRAQDNLVRLEFWPPTDNGSANLPTMWEHPGHARVLTALCKAYLKLGVLPGLRGAQEMHRAAALLASDCHSGHWHDLNRENAAKGIINVNTGVVAATALLHYRLASARMQEGNPPS